MTGKEEMTTEQKIQHIKTLNKARAKKYYQTHKEKINQKAKINRDKARNCLYNNCSEEEKNNEVKQINTKLKVVKANYEDLVNLINNLKFNKEKTKEDYLGGLNRLHKILQSNDYLTTLREPEIVLKKIYEYKQPNGKPFSVNTIKSTLQFLVYLSDNANLNLNKQSINAYKNAFKIYKIKSTDENNEKMKNKETILMSDYVQMVKDKFGEKSKMYLLVKMYEFLCVRDNYSNLKVVRTKTEMVDDGKTNYITVSPKKQCIIKISHFKTDSYYEPIEDKFPIPLSNMINNYVAENNIQYGGDLFGSNVSNFISKENKKLGDNLGSINEIRHRVISEALLNPNISEQQKLDLSDKMKHSPSTQTTYVRGNKKII